MQIIKQKRKDLIFSELILNTNKKLKLHKNSYTLVLSALFK